MNKKSTSKKLSKQEIEQDIKKTFKNNPTQKQIKKAKRLAMSKKIKFFPFRKKFCKHCFTFFIPNNYKIRIKKSLKIITCNTCGYVSRYRLN